MTKISNYIERFETIDENFVGTIAFRSEEIALPNESKMALGIDGSHWVLVYQKEPKATFQVFECDWHAKKILVDKKAGGEKELILFKKLVKYFLRNATVEDLITIFPSNEEQKP
ncbi:hypothetical protein A2291_05715 [candidate division WOR-1 bacterium RIFOXYB2_FULL_42_35]|uniref:Uncharacterized protein n=1 Tax=candidate division WOR-1 bacterium RIFOXYC2_FULL_41_25 TaxID=1802586 RepID=A0A1F4TK78_UNCSA|nr:MAG: hypothetical protein A2247_02355 [candidate division WOR-1 bacterium RIFOXYA2_FULL_41_14]OGC22415.1 MAG: hypothetical protein A2291_05715 [candidate division WOR-1 bacterium RIFOXYB2_FULL_42_35]OGC33094.1 MAG: hypothetical protein A2462_08625 [candidate division WOR-1 bacterium RIFOXYC2_FULL_41_25]OGC42908.1 MAG: hypothetical protein A2548_02410 [candidate division WOR-1 bacterium RIFOXYD2_FULL_41_8]